MSCSTTPCEDPAACAAEDAPDPFVLRAEHRLRLLEELAEIGMDLVRGLRVRAAADPSEAPQTEAARGKGREPADAFGPLSRAIRLTLALAARTDAELRDLKAGIVKTRVEEREEGAERGRLAAFKDREDRIAQVRDLVLRVAETDIEDTDALYRMADDLDERLEEYEAEFGSPDRPLRETVEGLCKAFGLSPDWSRWTGEGWSVDENALFEPFVTASRRPGAGLAQAASPPSPSTPPPPPRVENAFAPMANPPPPAPPRRLEALHDLE